MIAMGAVVLNPVVGNDNTDASVPVREPSVRVKEPVSIPPALVFKSSGVVVTDSPGAKLSVVELALALAPTV
jgi:hypothetical protein